MKFIPFADKVVFEPKEKDSILADDKNTLVEAGKVTVVGADVTFLKEGDTIAFLSYGAEKTPEIDGQSYWTVRVCPEFIMGRWREDEKA